MTERSFVQAILEEPEARENYLVFADWLDEQGEAARARLIRGQMELDSSRGRDASRQALAEEMRQVQGEVESSWAACRQWKKVFTILWDKGLPATAYLQGDWPGESAVRSLPAFPYLRFLSPRKPPPPELAELLIARTVFLTLCVECLNEDEVRSLGQLPDLKGLRIYDEGVLTDGYLEHLAPLRQLRSLSIHGEGITDAGLAHLRGLRHLERLGLERTQLTDAGLKSLLGFPGLKGRLKSLDIGGTRVTAKAIDLLVKCRQLRSLSLRGIEAIDDTNVMRLARLPELRELDLSDTGVTRYRMRRLSKFPRLERIRVLASLAIREEREEMREMEAFLKDMHEADLFVDVDYE